jgi:hypothetical protein
MPIASVRRLILAALSVLAFGAVLSAADQPPATGGKDILDEARRRDEVAQQKAEADFRAALIEMSKLEGTDPARAAERLKKMLAVLDEDTVLAPAKREAWKRVVKDRIRVAEVQADRAARGEGDNARTDVKKDERKVREEQKAREDELNKRDADEVKNLMKAGRTEDAQRLAADIARRNPDSPYAVASNQITGRANAVKQYRMVKDARENGWTLSLLDVEKSSVLPKDPDFNFPSPEKWREITKQRTKSVATEKEKAILQALDSPVTVVFEGSTLEATIDYLQTLSGVTIVLDKTTLDGAGLNYDTPINVRKMRNVTFRTALRKVLGEVGLTYIVEKETIHVLRPDEAKNKMTVRTYYLGDMATATNYTFGAAFTGAAMAENVAMLIQTIVGTVEPDSWQVNNPDAKGTIFYNPRNYTLVIKQSAEVHYMLGGGGIAQ